MISGEDAGYQIEDIVGKIVSSSLYSFSYIVLAFLQQFSPFPKSLLNPSFPMLLKVKFMF